MKWIIGLIARHRNFFSLLLTVTLSVFMIGAAPDAQMTITRHLTLSVFYPIHVTVSHVSNITGLYHENQRLRQELVETATQLQLIKRERGENQRLRGLLGFAEFAVDSLVPVRVIARDPSHLRRSVVVTGGRAHGVETYMPLVSEHGVVGKIVQVMGHMSMAQLLRDPSSRTSAMVDRSRAVGILQTENGRDFFVRLRNHEDVQQGDTIITSGLGGIYPNGLNIGTVLTVDSRSNPLFKKAYVEFAVEFDKVEELFVMLLPPQWSAQREELKEMEFGR